MTRFVGVKTTGDYHWFDGDGMLHACRIKGGSVTYCNKFVDTFKLAQEKQAGAAVFQKACTGCYPACLACFELVKARVS